MGLVAGQGQAHAAGDDEHEQGGQPFLAETVDGGEPDHPQAVEEGDGPQKGAEEVAQPLAAVGEAQGQQEPTGQDEARDQRIRALGPDDAVGDVEREDDGGAKPGESPQELQVSAGQGGR